jgi:hypothetical protein
MSDVDLKMSSYLIGLSRGIMHRWIKQVLGHRWGLGKVVAQKLGHLLNQKRKNTQWRTDFPIQTMK